jgi:hypothetical protein
MAKNASSEVLQRQQIPDLPPKMFYIPNFIAEDEEQRILEKVKLDLQHENYIICSTCLMCITDPCQPLDLSHTPPPAINSCSTHSKQYPSRLDKDATLADQPHRRSYIVSGNI